MKVGVFSLILMGLFIVGLILWGKNVQNIINIAIFNIVIVINVNIVIVIFHFFSFIFGKEITRQKKSQEITYF